MIEKAMAEVGYSVKANKTAKAQASPSAYRQYMNISEDESGVGLH